MKRRIKLIRIHSDRTDIDIKNARKAIFETGIKVNSKKIDAILGQTSLIPTHVRLLMSKIGIYTEPASECIQRHSGGIGA